MARKKETTVAIAERELTSETENDEQTAEENKRERVDLEALAPHDRVTITISVPAEFKLLVLKQAEEAQTQGAALVRNVLVEHFGYTLPESFTKRTRTTKYSHLSDEEKAQIQKANAKAQRDKVRKMLAALENDPELAARMEAQISQV